MFDAQTLAVALLIMRVVAVILIAVVIHKQLYLLHTTVTRYRAVRFIIMFLTMTLLVGQIIPIILDTVVAFGNLYPGRNPTPNGLAASYSLNNAIKDDIIGALLVILYYRPQKED